MKNIKLILNICMLMLLLAYVLIVKCKTMQKIGHKWWKALVPIYNKYIEAKAYSIDNSFPTICLITNVLQCLSIPFALYAGTYILANSLFSVLGGKALDVVTYWMIIQAVVMLNVIATFIHYVFLEKKSRAFNKSTWFALGMLFMPLIFESIIAFSGAEYKNIYNHSQTQGDI